MPSSSNDPDFCPYWSSLGVGVRWARFSAAGEGIKAVSASEAYQARVFRR